MKVSKIRHVSRFVAAYLSSIILLFFLQRLDWDFTVKNVLLLSCFWFGYILCDLFITHYKKL